MLSSVSGIWPTAERQGSAKIMPRLCRCKEPQKIIPRLEGAQHLVQMIGQYGLSPTQLIKNSIVTSRGPEVGILLVQKIVLSIGAFTFQFMTLSGAVKQSTTEGLLRHKFRSQFNEPMLSQV